MNQRRPRLTRWEALALTVVLTIGFTSLSAVLGLAFLAPAISITGLVILLPVIAIFGDRLPYIGDRTEPAAPGTADVGSGNRHERDDPVAKLRDRYARGEIDEAEFERRLERLIETEDLDATVDEDRDRVTELE